MRFSGLTWWVAAGLLVGGCGEADPGGVDGGETAAGTDAAVDRPVDDGGATADAGLRSDAGDTAADPPPPPPDRPDAAACPMVPADGPVPDAAEQVPPPPEFSPDRGAHRLPAAACVQVAPDRMSLTLPAGHAVNVAGCFATTLHESNSIADPEIVALEGNVLLSKQPGTTAIQKVSRGGIKYLDVVVTESDVAGLEVLPTATSLRLYQPQRWGARVLYRDGTTTDVSELARWSAEVEGSLFLDGFLAPSTTPRFVPFLPGVHGVATTFLWMRVVTDVTVGCQAFPVSASIRPDVGLVGEEGGHPGFFVWLAYPGGIEFVSQGPFQVVSSNPAIYAVSGIRGTCRGRGVAGITVALADRTLETTATCFDTPDAVGLTVEPMDPVNVDTGQTVAFGALGEFPGPHRLPVTAMWTSSAPEIASFGTGAEAHVLTAHRRGATEVTAVLGTFAVKKLIVVPR